MEERNDIVIYKSEDGLVKMEAMVDPVNETIWANQKAIAALFDVTVPNISYHFKKIFESGELDAGTVVKDFLITAQSGARGTSEEKVKYYNLDAIISIGYRVNSFRATKFRIWATQVLKRYMLKGFAVNRNAVSEQKYEDLKEPKFGGLTELGAASIRECERLGILVDLAHCDSTTIAMALEVAKKPVIISHTGLNTRLGSDEFMGNMMKARLISPAQAKMVADKGGVIGIWPHLASSPEEYASNIRAMVDIVGIDHVCIGTDSKLTPDYMEFSPEKMAEMKAMEEKRKQEGEKHDGPAFPQKNPDAVNHEWNDQPDNFYHSVIRCLVEEKFTDTEIEKIVSGNFCRIFDEATRK